VDLGGAVLVVQLNSVQLNLVVKKSKRSIGKIVPECRETTSCGVSLTEENAASCGVRLRHDELSYFPYNK
jgi:hypothetical protein